MAVNSAFLRAEATLAWIGQFEPSDQRMAHELLRAMTLVSRDEFAERLRSLIRHRVSAGQHPVGLYVERELPCRHGIPHRLFKESRSKVKRAFGVGPQPVKPNRAHKPDVGSEGLVAQIVSEICREQPSQVFNHPGPNAIRKYHIRRFILVTDFIGSGVRARTYLDAAWRVRSVRSWWSARAAKGLSFEVVAYAAAPAGRSNVESHPSKPIVGVVTTCPTIKSVGGGASSNEMIGLCKKYSPVKSKAFPPLGYCSGGVLMAFAHGVPNNAPAILHKRGPSWVPLFPERVTAATRGYFSSVVDGETLRERLVNLRQARLAFAPWIATASPDSRTILLTMAALSRSPRTTEAISGRTGLTVMEVEQSLAKAMGNGWINCGNALTQAGQAELAAVRNHRPKAKPLLGQADSFYYPRSLRAPDVASS